MKPDEPKTPEPAPDRCPKLPPQAERESAAPADDSKPTPPKLVFKIVRADPKNSFDFEDVADK